MMVKITQLQAAFECHTTEFAILRGAIAYVQRDIQWIHEHWDYKIDVDDSDDVDDGDHGAT